MKTVCKLFVSGSTVKKFDFSSYRLDLKLLWLMLDFAVGFV